MAPHVGMLTPSVSRRAGGLAPAVSALSKALTDNGTDVTVFAARDPDTERDLGDWTEIELSLRNTSGPAAFGLQPGLLRDLRAAELDVVHLHGLWTYPSLAALKWSAGRQPRIVSPHGMLDPWAVRNSGLKKKIVSALYEQRNLTRAACLHALCAAERDAIRDYGLKRPVAIVPNGVDLSIASGVFPRPEWYYRVPEGAKILLFLGRIHPKKGLALLLDALSRLERGEADQWQLVIAGWDQGGTEQQLVKQAAELGIAHRIHLVGPQFGSQKNATLAASDAFVLPSLSEGLPMAVLEAWAFSLPVLMTTACNLPEGFAADAAIQLEEGPAEMAEGLRRLTSLSEAQLCKMGANGYELVRRSFTWSEVARRMRQTYDWVLGGRDRPDFVDLV